MVIIHTKHRKNKRHRHKTMKHGLRNNRRYESRFPFKHLDIEPIPQTDYEDELNMSKSFPSQRQLFIHDLNDSIQSRGPLDIYDLNDSIHSRGPLDIHDLNDSIQSRGPLDIYDLNDSIQSRGPLDIYDLNDSIHSRGPLDIHELNPRDIHSKYSRSNSFGGKRRRRITKKRRGRKTRKYRGGAMCFGNGVGANNSDPNNSIYNTNMLTLFPYRPN
jgi:hypothetical protein